ncbi:MAG: hypothetical protein AB1918_00345 [Pseudomonadota bacterium]
MSRMGPRSGLLSRLAGLVRRGTSDKAPPPAPAKAPPPDLTDDSFRLAVQQMLQEDDGRYSTRLQIISLVEFREAVGDKWHQISDKVMLIAEGVIQLHIGPGNVYGRQGQDVFALLFRTCSHTEARRRALDIAKELGTRLVGDKVLGSDRPLALAAEVHLAGAVDADGTINPGAIAQAVNEMRAMVAIATQDAAGDESVRSWMKQKLAAPTPDQIRAHLRPGAPRPPPEPLPPRASLRPSEPPAGPIYPATPTPRPAAKAPPPAAPTGLIPLARHARPAPEWKPLVVDNNWGTDRLVDGPRPLPPDVRLSLLWRPTWVAGNETIGAFRAHIQRIDHRDMPALEGSHAYTGGNATSQSLDKFLIGQAMRAFCAAETAGLGSLVVLPVHWDSVYSTRRMELLAPMADATAEARAARLVIELFGVPADTPAEDVAAAVSVLRGLCRAVLLRVPLVRPPIQAAALAGAAQVGIDLADLTEVERTDDDRLLERLRGLLTQAEQAGTGTFVWGVRRRKVVAGAVAAGFDLINGPALMKDIARPAKAVPAPRARLLSTI